MDIKELEKAAEPEAFASYIAELTQSPGHDHGHGHGSGGSIETLREDDHEGHHITIRTTYVIEVDGKVLDIPLGLDNKGNLHCHSLPNYRFSSAIDMVKRLINSYPDDFKRKRSSKKSSAKKSPAKKSSKKSSDGDTHAAHKHAMKGGK